MDAGRRIGVVVCLAVGVAISSVADAKGGRSSSRSSSSASRSHSSAPERSSHDVTIHLRSGSSSGGGGDYSPGSAGGGSAASGLPKPAEPKLSPEDQRKRAEKQESEEATASDFWEKRKAERARIAEEARLYAEQQKLSKPPVAAEPVPPPVARAKPAGPAAVPVVPFGSAPPSTPRCVYKPAMSDAEIAACRNAR